MTVFAYWAWPSADIICGECGWVMSPLMTVYKGKPVRRLIYCTNGVCKNALQVFEVKTEHALELVPSGLPDIKITRM